MIKDAIIYLILNLIYSAFLELSVTLVYIRLIYFVLQNIADFNQYAMLCDQFQKWAFHTVIQFYGEVNYQQLIANSTLPQDQIKLLSEMGAIFIIFTVLFLVINMYKHWLKSVHRSYMRLVRRYYPQKDERSSLKENMAMEKENEMIKTEKV